MQTKYHIIWRIGVKLVNWNFVLIVDCRNFCMAVIVTNSRSNWRFQVIVVSSSFVTNALEMVWDVNSAVRLRVLQGICGMLLWCHEVRITYQREALMPLNGPLRGVCVCVCVRRGSWGLLTRGPLWQRSISKLRGSISGQLELNSGI